MTGFMGNGYHTSGPCTHHMNQAFAKNQALDVEIFSGKLTIAPATTGAFYFFNQAQSIKNALQYLAPSPTSAAKLEPLFTPKSNPNIPTHSKARYLTSSTLQIHLFPQRNYQILRSLSPLRMPFARLNLTAIWCHSSGI